jgi:hypothetical protein
MGIRYAASLLLATYVSRSLDTHSDSRMTTSLRATRAALFGGRERTLSRSAFRTVTMCCVSIGPKLRPVPASPWSLTVRVTAIAAIKEPARHSSA